MGKIKSSIYIDEDLWKGLKRRAVEAGLEISSLLEELIRDELMIGIEEDLLEVGGDLSCLEIDFEPVKPVEGLVSTLTRELRDERGNSLLRH
ncbi:MAG: hypothetical protein RMJ00_02965 [Nitrososphaerota archaeon]|nr:hypothetical protein [Candidatus Bathyarchaeota archaeon]MDW8061640.1 hypothetical protein [Nitrososphaerota archaeon]